MIYVFKIDNFCEEKFISVSDSIGTVKLVLGIPASSEVQGGAPSFPLLSAAIRFATDYLLWTRTFSSVAFVSSSVYLSLLDSRRDTFSLDGLE